MKELEKKQATKEESEDKVPFGKSDTLIGLITLSACATVLCFIIGVFGIAIGLSGETCADFCIASLIFAAVSGIFLGCLDSTSTCGPFGPFY